MELKVLELPDGFAPQRRSQGGRGWSRRREEDDLLSSEEEDDEYREREERYEARATPWEEFEEVCEELGIEDKVGATA